MRALLVAAIPAAGVPLPTQAAESPPALEGCFDSDAGGDTLGQLNCASTELERQDARLNRNYREAMARLNARQQDRLRAAESSWVAFRDNECRSYFDQDWGTLSRVEARLCVVRMTTERADYLAAYPHSQSGQGDYR